MLIDKQPSLVPSCLSGNINQWGGEDDSQGKAIADFAELAGPYGLRKGLGFRV